MKSEGFGRCALGICVAGVMLAGCGGPEPPIGAPATVGSSQGASGPTASAMVTSGKAKRSKGVLFVSNLIGSIRIYSADIHEKNPPLLRTITDGTSRPEGVWIDRKDTLYVVNASNGSQGPSLNEYKRGASEPFRTITNGLLYLPGAVAVGNDGTVYVNSVGESESGGLIGEVVVYAPGKTTPKETIALPEGPEYGMTAGGIALDSQGNVYVANEGNIDVVNVFEITPGSLQTRRLLLTGNGGDAIAVDGDGNLYAGGSGYFIAVYLPGATVPSRTIPNDFYAYGITATSNGTLYVVADNEVAEYAPGASEPTNSIDTLDGETFTYDAAIGSQ
jgi:sugar lactone lactonase YvrE